MAKTPSTRIAAIDAFRGFVMLLMMAEVLHFSDVAKKLPGNEIWAFLANQQTHVEWQGCSLHDLIQPSFSFLVGTALAFSLAKRLGQGDSIAWIFGHAAWRAFLLCLLGILLRSVDRKQTYWTFEDTLTQIGLGYLPLVATAFLNPRWQIVVVTILLVGYGTAFAIFPAPTPEYFIERSIPGAASDWPHHPTGFASHWDKNSNLAWKFDTWFLNLLPRETTFEYHSGGYCTLNFIPTLATMIIGLLAGNMLRSGISAKLVSFMVLIGVILLAAGFGLDWIGLCPNVKRIWTPSWTLFSGGLSFLLLAGFTATTDLIGRSEWAYPLKVIGANSIVAYVGSHLVERFMIGTLKTHFGVKAFQYFGEAYERLVIGVVVLLLYWLILFWMERKKIFIRL